MTKRILLAAVLGGIVLFLGVACQSAEPKADPASIGRGGALYDKWWKAAQGATEPSADHPLWATQTSNTRSGADTWRCKECHGWDYKGVDGAYGSGSHRTGFPGVFDASSKTRAQLVKILKGGQNSDHDFSTVLGEQSLEDLANFIREGLIDEKEHINYSTKKVIGADVAHGKQLFEEKCASCHGADGKTIDFGDGEGVGTLANDNPWETLHKIRFGNPGTPMPRGVELGWSVEDSVDVLGYAQSLPE